MSNDSEVTAAGDVGGDPADQGTTRTTRPRHRAGGRGGVRRFLPSPKLAASLVLLVVSLAGAAFAIALAVVEIPEPNDFATREASIFTWDDGSRITHVGVNRQPVEFDRIPKVVRDAVLAAEDRSFYGDPGVSVTGLLRAVKNNITSDGGSLQGGSTITQQYVKNYYLTQEQTFSRKAEEILVSIKIANEVPKDIVLRDYLNTAFFARGTYGVEAASRAYFGVPVGDLAEDPARAAYIAAIIQAPYYYATAPDDPEAAKALRERWDYVLDGMVQEGWLEAGKRAGLAFPEPVKYEPDELTGVNGYAVDAATQYLNGLHERDPSVPDAAMLTRGGYTVQTTYRPEVMSAVERAVTAGLANLDPARPEDRDVHLAVACVDTATGAVVGFRGGPGYLQQSFNDAFQANGPIGRLGGLLVKSLLDSSERSLESMRIFDARDDGKPPGPNDFATTPMRAAAADVYKRQRRGRVARSRTGAGHAGGSPGEGQGGHVRGTRAGFAPGRGRRRPMGVGGGPGPGGHDRRGAVRDGARRQGEPQARRDVAVAPPGVAGTGGERVGAHQGESRGEVDAVGAVTAFP